MKILLGITGGIAAYKSLYLLRLLRKSGHSVQVVMTESAKKFIVPLSFQALSGLEVRDSLFGEQQENSIDHIELARWADIIVIAPATANIIGKLRVGMADDLLSTICLATDKTIIIAPSMNHLMWHNTATQENVEILRQRQFQIITPQYGDQACGESGEGCMAKPESIVDFITQSLPIGSQMNSEDEFNYIQAKKFWHKRTILITAGPTHEPIDPVRFISNRSSGKMGFALAKAAVQLGANVLLVTGPVNLNTPHGVERKSVTTAEQMFQIVQEYYSYVDIIISAAAIADYKVLDISKQKIKKSKRQEQLNLKLVKNPDIISWIAQQQDRPYLVGFAAETENLLQHARFKLESKKLDMICANLVGNDTAFDTDDNQISVITPEQQFNLPKDSKSILAQQILKIIANEV